MIGTTEGRSEAIHPAIHGAGLAVANIPHCYCTFFTIGAARQPSLIAFGERFKVLRKGLYHVHKLIAKYGRSGNMMKWKEQLNGDCPRRDAHALHERCDLRCPDLPKVLMTVPPLNEFIVFVVYEFAGADDMRCFFVGVSLGHAEHSLAGPFQTSAAARAWIETQTTIGRAMASP